MEIKWKQEDTFKYFLDKTTKVSAVQKEINKELQKSNENLVIYHNLLQDIKSNLIIDFPNEYGRMIDYIKVDDRKEGEKLNQNVFIKNGISSITNESFMLNSKDFYNNYAVLGGIEKQYYKSDRSKLTNEDRLFLKELKNDLNSNIIKENNIENTRLLVSTLDLSKLENNDNLKLATIELILDKQKDLKDRLLEYNHSLITGEALKLELKKGQFKGVTLTEEIKDTKIELIREFYKSVYSYKPLEYSKFTTNNVASIDENGNKTIQKVKELVLDANGNEKKELVKFTTYAYQKIQAECFTSLKNYYNKVNEELKYQTMDFEKLDTMEIDEYSVFKEKRIIDDSEMLNVMYSRKNSNSTEQVDDSENVFRSLIQKDGKLSTNQTALDKTFRVIEDCTSDGVEFLKAAMCENGFQDDIDNVDKKWIDTFKKYIELKKEAIDGNVLYLRIFKNYSDTPEKTMNLFNQIKDEDIEVDEFLKNFDESHRKFMKKLIEKDSNTFNLELGKKFKDEDFSLGERISLNLNDYYGELLEQNRINDYVKKTLKDGMVFGNALINADESLIEFHKGVNNDDDLDSEENKYKFLDEKGMLNHIEDITNRINDSKISNKEQGRLIALLERYSEFKIESVSDLANKYLSKLNNNQLLNYDNYVSDLKPKNDTKNYFSLNINNKPISEDSKLIKINSKDIDTNSFFKDYKTIFSDIMFEKGHIPDSTMNQYMNFKNSLAKQLSNGSYEKVEKQYVGKYQFDAATLASYGLIDKTKFDSLINETNKNKMNDIYESFIKDPNNWTSNKCNSLESFLKNTKLQEELMDIKTMDNFKELNSNIRENSIDYRFKSLDDLRPWENFGLLSVAHVAGINNTMNLIENGDSTFTNQYGGKVLEKYYKIGKEATKLDINQSLYDIKQKEYNYQDFTKDFSIAERMFNPMVQLEYFSKEFTQLFSNIHTAINNHRFANAQKEIENSSYDKVLGKIEKDMNSAKENKTNIYKENKTITIDNTPSKKTSLKVEDDDYDVVKAIEKSKQNRIINLDAAKTSQYSHKR